MSSAPSSETARSISERQWAYSNILPGAVATAVFYIQVQQVRRRIIDTFHGTMEGVDFLVTPTEPTAATPLEGDPTTRVKADPDRLAAETKFSGPYNLTGFSTNSIPCGFTPGGLPVGMQRVAKPWQEGPLLPPRMPTSRRQSGIAGWQWQFGVLSAGCYGSRVSELRGRESLLLPPNTLD